MIKSLNHINTSIQLNKIGSKEYQLTDVYPEDYVNVFYHQYIASSNSYADSYWINGIHYRLKQDISDPSKTVIEVLVDYNENGHDSLYITGLKLSNKRSF